MLNAFKNSRGFSMVENLIALGLVVGIGAAGATIAGYYMAGSKNVAAKTSLEALASSLQSSIANQDAWDITRSHNTGAMSCITHTPADCPPNWQSSISLYNSEGIRVVDAANANQGFRPDGSICNSFVAGTDQCIIRATISWGVSCTTVESCKFPGEKYTISFFYKGEEKLDIGRYGVRDALRTNFAENQSPIASCSRTSQVFIGFGKQVRNGDLTPFTADSNGCVDLAAFKGKTGDSGDQGYMGVDGSAYYPTGGTPGSPPTVPPNTPFDPPTTPGEPYVPPGYTAVSASCASQYSADYCYLRSMLNANPATLNDPIAAAGSGLTTDPAKWLQVGQMLAAGKSMDEIAAFLWLDNGAVKSGVGDFATLTRLTVQNANALGVSTTVGIGFATTGAPEDTSSLSIQQGIANAINTAGASQVKNFISTYGTYNSQVAGQVLSQVNAAAVAASSVGEVAYAAMHAHEAGVTTGQISTVINYTGSATPVNDFIDTYGSSYTAAAAQAVSSVNQSVIQNSSVGEVAYAAIHASDQGYSNAQLTEALNTYGAAAVNEALNSGFTMADFCASGKISCN